MNYKEGYCLQCANKAGTAESDFGGLGCEYPVVCYGCGLVNVDWEGACTGCAQHDLRTSRKEEFKLIQGGKE